jgi:hypothetical protein
LLGIGEPGRGRVGALTAIVRIPLTFAFVTVGWLFFRLTHLGDVGLLFSEFVQPWRQVDITNTGRADVTLLCVLSAVVVAFHLPLRPLRSYPPVNELVVSVRPYVLGVLVAVILMASGSQHAFIYFQF